jgi:hypothetical protein
VFNGTLGTPIDGVTPVVGISLEDGLFIRAQVAPVYMTWTDQQDVFPSPTGGLISSFSSYGLPPDLSLKPDIGAPGGNIYSTIPLEQGGYGIKGGTSMASPHVAGAAALVLQAKPGTKPLDIREMLQNSADPALWSLNTTYGLYDHVHRQGAGMVDIDDAILATTKITPAKLALGESEAGPYEVKLTVRNDGPDDVTYELYSVPAIGTVGTYPSLGFFLGDEAVEFKPSNLHLKAGQQRDVRVTIDPATGPDHGLYGGYLVFEPMDGGRIYRVPYAGFVGDYQSITVLEPTGYEFPWLAYLDGGYYNKVTDPADWTFTMEGADIAYFLVHLEHQPQVFTMEVFDADSGKSMFWAYQDEYLPRNSGATSFFAFPWDGTTTPGKSGKRVFTMPDGEYVVKLSILKALGDKNNPDHWETWTSPVIVIDRP